MFKPTFYIHVCMCCIKLNHSVSFRQAGSRKDTAPSNEIDPISKKHAILRQIRGRHCITSGGEATCDADIQDPQRYRQTGPWRILLAR